MSDRDRNQRDRGRAPKRDLSSNQDDPQPQRIRQESNYSRDNRGGYNNRGGGNGGYGGGYNNRGGHPTGKIDLQTNFFKIVSRDNWILYQYHITFEPEILSKKLRCGLLGQHYESTFNNSKAFDGGSTLFSMTQLPEKITNVQSQCRKDNSSVNIIIDLVKEIHPGDDVTIQIFNIIFKKCLNNCNLKEFGKQRAYYNFNESTCLNEYLKIVSGFKTSIEIYNGKLLLCSEVANKLISTNTVYSEIREFASPNINDTIKAKIAERLVGKTVITCYNNKAYKIDDIAWETRPTDRFQTRLGETSFQEYYRSRHGKKISDLNQPLLLSRPRKSDKRKGQTSDFLLIPEFCALTGQDLIDKRNSNLKNNIQDITKLNPQNRFNKLTSFIRKIKQSENAQQDLNNWRMDINENLVTLEGTVLKEIKVLFGNGKVVENTANGWDYELKRAKHIKTNPLNVWWIFYEQRDENKVKYIKSEIPKLTSYMGFSVLEPRLILVPNNNALSFSNEINKNLEIHKNQKPQLIMCIIQSNNHIYNAIKTILCVQNSIPSQCITQNIIDLNDKGKAKSVLTKVAIQMSAKLGGEIWGINFAPKIMVIGIDMYRDSSNRNEAALAFVASMNGDDKNLSRYYSRVVMQAQDALYANNLKMLMEDTLKNYLNKNNYLPERIFIYRDGASDAQLRNVLEFEINGQVKAAFESFDGYKPKLTVLVVQKRGSTRFFYRNNGAIRNPPIGTVIDNTVTGRKVSKLIISTRDSNGNEHSPRLERYDNNNQEVMKDFYLISQKSNQGTVSPSHFRILLNENEPYINDERLQILTYKLNHYYYNWPGQIRVPAPCHYAHKLAHLVGESLHQSHHLELNNNLFYL